MEQLFSGGLDDVVVEIFIELPSGDLAKCRRVCKLWRRVVDLILRDDRILRDRGFLVGVIMVVYLEFSQPFCQSCYNVGRL